MENQLKPQWQPIDALPMIANAVRDMYDHNKEQYQMLLQAKDRPHVMDDYTINRVIQVYTTQRDDLWMYDEQLNRWKNQELTRTEQREIEKVDYNLSKNKKIVDSILSLANEISKSTINKILAKDDVELALEFLEGRDLPVDKFNNPVGNLIIIKKWRKEVPELGELLIVTLFKDEIDNYYFTLNDTDDLSEIESDPPSVTKEEAEQLRRSPEDKAIKIIMKVLEKHTMKYSGETDFADTQKD